MVSCSSPTALYENKIEQIILSESLGADVSYKSLEFEWIDTLTHAKKLKREIAELVRSEKDYEEILSKNLKENIDDMELYLLERMKLSKSNTENFEYWNNSISEYRKLLETKSKNDSINVAYQIRKSKNNFYGFSKYGTDKFNQELYQNEVLFLEWSKSLMKIDSLKEVNPPKGVVHYLARNKYAINNPSSSTELKEIERFFYFDSTLNIYNTGRNMKF